MSKARYFAAAPTLASGDATDLQADSAGNLKVTAPTSAPAAVQGPAADGAAVAGNPVRVAGKDGSGNTQDIATDTSGNVSVFSGGFTSSADFLAVAAAIGAGDVMAGAQTFANVGPAAGGEVLITNARFEVHHTAVISGETTYDLHLYNVTPPSALADNTVWDLPSGDRASYLGKISLGAPVDVGSTLYVEQTGINKQVTVPSGGSLFAYLVTNGAFTATAAIRKATLKTIRV